MKVVKLVTHRVILLITPLVGERVKGEKMMGKWLEKQLEGNGYGTVKVGDVLNAEVVERSDHRLRR
jgi:hypothetical protein